MTEVTWCSNCLAMSTRPRISFDQRGWCNACQWMEKKKSLDWDSRKGLLHKILDKHRSSNGSFDCLVPVSGGKDGSYVAYNLKHKYSMNPLCVTITPPLPLDLGEQNLKSFINSGYNHISVNPSESVMRALNKKGFMELGFPYYGWLIAITSAPLRVAASFGINLVFYGEDGEVEYGGSQETSSNPLYSMDYMKKIYLEGGYEKVINSASICIKDRVFFDFPNETEFKDCDPKITHWSYFENWDPYRNYMIAKEFCGLQESDNTNSGTFTNFAQTDQALYSLHAYIMYLKYGFGRANQDASIEIRRGAMDRDQAVNLVNLYDGQYPEEFLEIYLDYYELKEDEFNQTLDKWANKDLFKKESGKWRPIFKIK